MLRSPNAKRQSSVTFGGPRSQIAFKCAPLFASNNDPVSVRHDGDETGGGAPHSGAEPVLAGGEGRLCAVLEAPAVVASLDDVAVRQAIEHQARMRSARCRCR
jgi:hypothetical protein